MITLYGIPNCDTVRKARRWLEQHAVDYRFHDVRADGLNAEATAAWVAKLGHEQLINRRSTSWRALSDTAREGLDDTRAAALILEQPTLMRRPLLDKDGELHTGFSVEQYRQLFGR